MRMEVIHVNNYNHNFQLNFTLQHGLEAMRMILLEGFNKGAKFVNTAKKIEQIGWETAHFGHPFDNYKQTGLS